MNPIHLRTFLTIRKHMNYTRAGEELFLSQPAVSRQIQQLEQELEVRLFERLGRTLHLTDAGEALAEHAERILAHHDRAAEAVRSHRSAVAGRLRIGASTTPGLYLLPEVLVRLGREHPEVAIQFSIENSLRIEQRIVRNEFDLGFVGAHLSSDELRLDPVLEDEIVCYASASHPLARRRRIDPRALAGATWITRERGSATRQLFEGWLSSHGVRAERMIELHCPEEAKALVRAGVGISFISRYGLDEKAGQLAALRIAGLELKRPLYLARHVGKHTSPAMEALLGAVREVFAARSRLRRRRGPSSGAC